MPMLIAMYLRVYSQLIIYTGMCQSEAAASEASADSWAAHRAVPVCWQHAEISTLCCRGAGLPRFSQLCGHHSRWPPECGLCQQ